MNAYHIRKSNRRQFLYDGLGGFGMTALSWPLANAANADVPRPIVPDFGIMLNDDAGRSFTDLDPNRSNEALQAKIRSLKGTAVKTLIYQVVAGSEIALYPTRVASAWGWRQATGEQKAPWKEQMPWLRAAVSNGLDAGRVAGEEARKMGLHFIAAYRMNDAHFASKPFDHPATGKFWIENHERLKIGIGPSERMQFVANLLDYTHAEVREHRLAIIAEIVDRYADIMDGIQLDFMRQPFLFPPGTGQERRELMTEFMTRVRALLDEASRRVDRFLSLSVRVPPTLQGCRWCGLDVPVWLDKQLVNMLVLSPSMTLAHDMPVDEFVTLAQPVGAKIFPAMFRHTPSIHAFSMQPSKEVYQSRPSQIASAAQIRGAALNYLPMGAAGFELYNFNLPPAPFTLEAIDGLANPRSGERIYAVTQAFATDRENLVEYRKQIPANLSGDASIELTLIVGEDLSERRRQPMIALRLGLFGLKEQRLNLRLGINGHSVHDGPIDGIVTPVTSREARPSKIYPPSVEYYIQVRIINSSIIRTGRNQLTIDVDSSKANVGLQLVEVQLAVRDDG